MKTMLRMSANGTNLWVEMSDEGEPLVLVHGSWVDHHAFAAVAPYLVDRFQVVTYDRRGHSQSHRPPGQGRLDDDVADLAALIENLGTGPAHIAGHSLGGSIALRLAAVRPDLVSDVTAHEPPLASLLQGHPEADTIAGQLGEQIKATASLIAQGRNQEAAAQFVEFVFGPGHWRLLPVEVKQTFVTNAATFLDETNDPRALTIDTQMLPGLTVPVLLTQGTESPPLFWAVTDKLACILPHARRATIDGAGHAAPISRSVVGLVGCRAG